MPNNPLMQRDRGGDSRGEALTYLKATIGEEGRATTRARKEAFVDGVADFVNTAEKYGVTFMRAADYPDYYPELPGGKIGRGLEVKPFDIKKIGEWWKTCQAPVALPIKTDDIWLLGRAWSAPAGFLRRAQLVFRALGGIVTGKKLGGIGAGFAAAFLDVVVQKQGANLWLNTPLQELIVEDGCVVGVQVARDGKPLTIGAARGVMLAGGGFDHNEDLRQKHHGIEGAPSGAPGNLGRPIEIAQDNGAALELMDDAWWGGSVAAAPATALRLLWGSVPCHTRSSSMPRVTGSQTSLNPTSTSDTTCSNTTRTARTGWSETCGTAPATCAPSQLTRRTTRQ